MQGGKRRNGGFANARVLLPPVSGGWLEAACAAPGLGVTVTTKAVSALPGAAGTGATVIAKAGVP